MLRYWLRSLLFMFAKITGIFYKSPANFSYWWNFGFLSFYFLLSQLITGIILAMFYNANADMVFNIVFDMTSEVYYGWWLRNMHANGASFFFLVVYLHMARGIYYCSFMYPRQLVWISGAMIWLLMIATAFLGYMLPWGQMSFWGAMVITSLLGALPGVGADMLLLLWGSYSIDNSTLHRFYSLHYTLPFVIFMMTIVHFALLHEFGSSNGLGIAVVLDHIPFLPYYGIKDGFSIMLILMLFFLFVMISPDILGHSDNFMLANSLVTPAHIVPEWYFLPLYAILRSVTNKLLGMFLIACAVCCIILFPFFCKNFIVRSTLFKPGYGFLMWMFFAICYLLGWIGSLPVMTPFFEIGQIVTFAFFFFFFLFPILGLIEKVMYFMYAEKSNIVPSMHTYTINETTLIAHFCCSLMKKFMYLYV